VHRVVCVCCSFRDHTLSFLLSHFSATTLKPINLVHNKFGHHNFGYHNFGHKFRKFLVFKNFCQISRPWRPFSRPVTWLIFRFLASYSDSISKIMIIMSKQNVEVLTCVKLIYFQCIVRHLMRNPSGGRVFIS
jgi:hypothetical protein